MIEDQMQGIRRHEFLALVAAPIYGAMRAKSSTPANVHHLAEEAVIGAKALLHAAANSTHIDLLMEEERAAGR